MNRAQNYASRSWTETQQPVRRRPWLVTLLLLSLIVTVVAFVWWLIPKPEQRVFAFGFAVEETSERHLPRPAFARWDLSGCQLETWSPWLLSDTNQRPVSVVDQPGEFCKRVENGPQLRDVLSSIQNRLREAQVSHRDTLIIYIRGSALVLNNQNSESSRKLFLLAPEDTSPTVEPRGIPLDEFFAGMAEIRVANVVVLADFADLTSAPQFGLLENEIPMELARILEGLQASSDSGPRTPVWVVLSRGSQQPSHYSHLLKKSLLQSSAEFALTSVSADEKQRHLPLTDFYMSMLRYAHDVTGGTQTPLLFRSGSANWIQDTSSQAWLDAAGVHMALRAINGGSPDSAASESETGKSARESPGESRTGSYAAFRNATPTRKRPYFITTAALSAQQQSTPAVTPAVAPSDSGSKTSEVPLTSEATQAPETPDPDLWLRFWQLRDELASRKVSDGLGMGWSPADFSVDRWQGLQREAIRNERLWQLSVGSTGSMLNPTNLQTEMIGLNSQLEQLILALRSNSFPGQASPSLVSDWLAFRARLGAPENPQRVWLDANLLAADLQPRWAEAREQLQDFVDVSCESAAWMELCLEPAIHGPGAMAGQLVNQVDQFRPQVYELVDQIQLFKQQLSGRSSVLERPFNASILERILSLRSQLRRDFDRVVDECRLVLETDSEPLSWQWERTAQVLLTSPLLSYPQRRSLVAYYRNRDSLVQRLRRPDQNNASLNTDLPLAKLLPTTENSSLDSQAWKRKLFSLLDGSQVTDRWFRSCFNQIWPLGELTDFSQDAAGIILSPSGDKGLTIVSIPSGQAYRHQLPSPLTVVIRHRNGTSLGGCWIQWQPTEASSQGRRMEVNLSDRSGVLPSERPHSISLNRDEFSMTFTMPDGAEVPLEGIPIRLKFARQESDLGSAETREVIVLPPNPDRIDLFARRWDAAKDRLESSVLAAEEFGSDLWLKNVVQAPAIGGQAQAQYQFYLCNRSDKDRTVRVRLYGVQSPLDTGNGAITEEAIIRTRREQLRKLQLIATVPSLPLPGLPLSKLTTQLEQMPGNERELKLPVLEAGPVPQGQFGLLMVVDDSPAEGVAAAEIIGKPQYIWLDTVSQSPCPLGRMDQWLVQISHQRRESSDVDFSLQVPDSVWSRWGLEKLRVEVLLTDERGTELANRSPSVVELSPISSEATISVRPNFDSLVQSPESTGRQPNKVIAHFHVGGYPRAAAFEYRVAGGLPAAAAQAFLWLDPNNDATEPDTEIRLSRADGQRLIVHKLDPSTFVVPNRTDVTATSTGMPANAESLGVPFRLDFPKVSTSYSASIRLGSLTQLELRHDRKFNPLIEVLDGRLAFSSAAQDHRYEWTGVFSNALLRGRIPLALSIDGTDMQRQVNFIFDTEKPQRSKVELPSGSSLYEGGMLQVEMSVRDEESEIKEVYFAVNRERTNQQEIQYDDQDDLPVKADFVDGKWIASLKHDSLAKADILRSPGSSYDIVARSVDWAGNVQDAHRPARFFWQGKRKSPPPKTPAK